MSTAGACARAFSVVGPSVCPELLLAGLELVVVVVVVVVVVLVVVGLRDVCGGFGSFIDAACISSTCR